KLLGLTYQSQRQTLLGFLRGGVHSIVLKDEVTPDSLVDRVESLLQVTMPPKAASDNADASPPAAVLLPAIVTQHPPDTPPPAPVEPEKLRELFPKMSQAKALRPVVHQVVALAGNPN